MPLYDQIEITLSPTSFYADIRLHTKTANRFFDYQVEAQASVEERIKQRQETEKDQEEENKQPLLN